MSGSARTKERSRKEIAKKFFGIFMMVVVMNSYMAPVASAQEAAPETSADASAASTENQLPTLTLEGGDITLCVGESYDEPGYSATVGADISVSGEVDESKVGVYELRYTATNNVGSDTLFRFVTVSDEGECAPASKDTSEGNTAPTITLLGDNPLEICINTQFDDPGAQASDTEDGDISSTIDVSGTVDTSTDGTYVITYTVTDSDGATDTVFRDVVVKNDSSCNGGNGDGDNEGNHAPSITLIGGNPITLTSCESFTDPGATAVDTEDGLIPFSAFDVSGTVDTSTPGTYTLTYTITDSDGATDTVFRDVVVTDGGNCGGNGGGNSNTAPTITLLGNNPLEICINSIYTDPGVTASDVEDGNITSDVVISGSVNASVVGIYTITYTVADSDGATDTVFRDVVVKNDSTCDGGNGGNGGNTAPTISLLGNNPLEICINTTFTDPGATASDIEDGNITSLIQISGSVDASTLGTYTITYIVTDSDGATDTVFRDVVVKNDSSCNGGGGNGGNHAPNAENDSASTNENESVVVDVLANDSDSDGDTIMLESVTDPANGTVAIEGDDVRYTPESGFEGTDTFDYTIEDEHGASDTATVTVTVGNNGNGGGGNGGNGGGGGGGSSRPRARNDEASTRINTPVFIDALDNDRGTRIEISDVENPDNGSVEFDEDGVIYTPDAGFIGTDTFEYTIEDRRGRKDSALITVHVGDVAGVSITGTCPIWIEDFLHINFNNDSFEVMKLQAFLNAFEGESLAVDGVFDWEVFDAVSRFQKKYNDDVLNPWGYADNESTGYVYITTRHKINEIFCNTMYQFSAGQLQEINQFNNLITSLKARGAEVGIFGNVVLAGGTMPRGEIGSGIAIGVSEEDPTFADGTPIKDITDTEDDKIVLDEEEPMGVGSQEGRDAVENLAAAVFTSFNSIMDTQMFISILLFLLGILIGYLAHDLYRTRKGTSTVTTKTVEKTSITPKK